MRKLIWLGLMAVSVVCFSGEESIRLKDGPGKELVMNSCATCHSLDYIQMNSVFMNKKQWEATVNKMVKTFKAPVDEKDIPAIVEYLTNFYGVRQ